MWREHRYGHGVQVQLVLHPRRGVHHRTPGRQGVQVWPRSKGTVCAPPSARSSPPHSLTGGSTGVCILCLKKENKKKLVVGTNKSTNKGTDKVMNRKRNYQKNGQKDYRDIEIERKSAFFFKVKDMSKTIYLLYDN